jgi:3',5'-cyclic AMP phosphodiesterase CpdA
MPKILQISDLHFGPHYVPEVGEALQHIVPSLEADAIVVNGDVSQRAKRQQFADARAFLERLPQVPTLIVPGNHDVPLYRIFERLLQPHALYRKMICLDLNPVLCIDGAILAGIDSTAPRSAISNGRIHAKQLQRCGRIFAQAAPQAVKIVVAHHHFAPGPDYLHDRTMPKARRAIDCFVDQGVEIICGGHLHRSYIGNSLDFFPGNHRDRGIIILQCGTSTSSRGRGRERNENTFNLVDISARRITVVHYMYFETYKRFSPVSRHQFPRQGCPFELTD